MNAALIIHLQEHIKAKTCKIWHHDNVQNAGPILNWLRTMNWFWNYLGWVPYVRRIVLIFLLQDKKQKTCKLYDEDIVRNTYLILIWLRQCITVANILIYFPDNVCRYYSTLTHKGKKTATLVITITRKIQNKF